MVDNYIRFLEQQNYGTRSYLLSRIRSAITSSDSLLGQRESLRGLWNSRGQAKRAMIGAGAAESRDL